MLTSDIKQNVVIYRIFFKYKCILLNFALYFHLRIKLNIYKINKNCIIILHIYFMHIKTIMDMGNTAQRQLKPRSPSTIKFYGVKILA